MYDARAKQQPSRVRFKQRASGRIVRSCAARGAALQNSETYSPLKGRTMSPAGRLLIWMNTSHEQAQALACRFFTRHNVNDLALVHDGDAVR